MTRNRDTEDSIKHFKINNDIMIGSFKGKVGPRGRTKTYFTVAETQEKDNITSASWMSITEAKKLNKNLTKLITVAEAR